MDRRHHPLFPHVMSRHALIAGAFAFGLFASACGGSDTEAGVAEPAEAAATTEAVETAEASETTVAADTTPETEAPEPASDDASTFFPDVLDATATQADDGTWTFSVTLSSPYDTPAQYADAWRVVDADGAELGFRLLTHDHANEQPFTRSHSGIEIPDRVTTVIIEGRDQANGWGGDFLEFELPT